MKDNFSFVDKNTNPYFRAKIILKSFFMALCLVLISEHCEAQSSAGANIGTSVYQLMKVESNQSSSVIKPVTFPSPFFELNYIKELNAKGTNLNLTLRLTDYSQSYKFIPHAPDSVFDIPYTEFTSWLNIDVQASIENLIWQGQKSNLHVYYGISFESMHTRLGEIFVGGTISSPYYKRITESKFQVSPALNTGIVFRLKNASKHFWQFGLGATYCFSNSLGTSKFVYNNQYRPETGKYVYKGSCLSLKVGYLFQFKNPGKSNNS